MLRRLPRLALLLLAALAVPCLAPLPAAAADGDLDASFNQPFFTGIDVQAVVRQSDGKYVVGGDFTQVNGVDRSCIARFNADGTLDATFNPGLGFNGIVQRLFLQTDGKLICVGSFFAFNGTPRSFLARLNSDGSLDPTYDPASLLELAGGGPGSGFVGGAALQSGDRLVLIGGFDKLGASTLANIVRLLSDGTVDATFTPGTGFTQGGALDAANLGTILTLPGDALLVSGTFDAYNGNSTPLGVARLGANGAFDATYSIGTGPSPANEGGLVAVDSAGNSYWNGNFVSWNGVPRVGVVRLTPTGAVDTAFNANLAPGSFVYHVGFSLGVAAPVPDGGVFLCGNIHTVGGATRQGVVKLTSTGALDSAFDSSVGLGQGGVGTTVLGLPAGGAFVGGRFSSAGGLVRGGVAIFGNDGAVSTTFAPTPGVYRGNGNVSITAVQVSTGKTFVGGLINFANNLPTYGLSRLNADGTLDTTFNAGTNQGSDFSVRDIAFQPDGKVIIVGGFLYYNGVSRRRIARLNPDGSLDPTFDPGLGFDNIVYKVRLLPDGSMYCAGAYQRFNGEPHSGILKLTSTGALDPSFNPGPTPIDGNSAILALAVQSDGRVIVGGSFPAWNGAGPGRVVRLLPSGTRDTAFAAGAGANAAVSALLVQPDDKILVGGQFTQLAGVARSRYGRLLADGSLDSSFAPVGNTTGTVRTIYAGPDGTTYLGGSFQSFNNNTISRRTVARLLPTGAVDTSFNVGLGAQTQVYGLASPTAAGTVFSISLGAGASTLYIGGQFTTFNGSPKGALARVLVTPPAGLYGSWLAANFTPAEQSDPQISGDTADPDGDGIPNLAEYAFNLNPRSNSATGLPVIAVAPVGGQFANEITFTRLVPSTGITYVVETSGDGITWTTNNATLVNTVPQGATERVTFRDNTTSGTNVTHRFIRVRVTKP